MNLQLQKAVGLDQRGDLPGAIAVYRAVLASEPDNIDALFLLGRAHCLKGEFDRGAELLGKAVSLAPNYAQAHNLLGMALGRLGRKEEALASFEHATVADPANAAAIVNKADVLADLGRHADAVAEFDKALAINPRNVAAWCNRGNALQALERDAEAIESFGKALALDPRLVVAQFNMANALERLGRHEEAVARYCRAIALKPDFADAYINLAGPLMALERWTEVVECSDQAIKLRPNAVQPYCNRGQALSELGRHPESVASYDAALAIDADYVRALKRKASLSFILGRFDGARAAAEKINKLDPRETHNFLMLAQTKDIGPDDPEVAQMENLLQEAETLSDVERGQLHFALGKIYGNVGEHDRSFRHYIEANAIQRRQFDYDEKAHLDALALVREIYTPEFIAAKSGRRNPSTQPIFIVGMPRSGSTLLEQILAGHPRVHAGGELRAFPGALAAIKGSSNPDQVLTMTPEEFDKLGALYLERATDSMPPVDRFTDKMLGNIIHAGLIHLTLPNARIIHARRDPIDSCLSSFTQNFRQGGPPYANDLGELGRYYRAIEQLAEHWSRVLPAGVMLDVRYEDVVADIEGQARRVLDFCGLEWDEACLAFHKVERVVMTASAVQVRKPLYRTSVGRWRAYADHLQPLFSALGLPAPDDEAQDHPRPGGTQ